MIKIEGPRLTLRTMTREEMHASRQKYVSDPVMDPNPYVYDPEKVDALYDKNLARAETYPVVGVFTAEGDLIGELDFKRVDREASRCELGIMLLDDRYKGQGYGGEAFAMALAYAFEGLGLDQVFADTMGSNLRMQRILDRLGFRCYLRLTECYDMGDRWEDRLDYVITREEYLRGKASGPC